MMRQAFWGIAALVGVAAVLYRVLAAGPFAIPDLAVGVLFGAAVVEFMWAGEETEG